MAVALVAIPGVEGRHHRESARSQRRRIGRQVNAPKLCFADPSIPLLNAFGGAAVPNEVFQAGRDALVTQVALQTFYKGRGKASHESRVFGAAFVGATPAPVPGHSEGGREGPIDPGGQHLPRRGAADPPHQVRIVDRSKVKVVGKYRRPAHIAVPVNGIYAVQDGNGEAARALGHGGGPVGIVHGDPIARAVVPGAGAAPAQHRPYMVVSHLLWSDHQPLRLQNLPDLLHEAHLLDEAFNERMIFRA